MFNIFQCAKRTAKHLGDRFAMAPGLGLLAQVMPNLFQVLWSYRVPALSALDLPNWRSFCRCAIRFCRHTTGFSFPERSLLHMYLIHSGGFFKRLKDLDLELSITKQTISKTCIFEQEEPSPHLAREFSSSHSSISLNLQFRLHTWET